MGRTTSDYLGRIWTAVGDHHCRFRVSHSFFDLPPPPPNTFRPNQDISLPLAIGWSCFGAFLHGAGTNINAVALSTAGAMLGFVIVHMIVRAAVYCRGKRRSVLSYHEQQQLDQESLLQKLSDQLVTENAINSTQRDYVSVLYHS